MSIKKGPNECQAAKKEVQTVAVAVPVPFRRRQRAEKTKPRLRPKKDGQLSTIPLLVSTKSSIPSPHVSSLPTFSEIIRSTSCQTRSAVTNGCVCAHACYSHMGAAEISAGGENFFSQGGGLAKKTQGGGLFLKFRVWVGRV